MIFDSDGDEFFKTGIFSDCEISEFDSFLNTVSNESLASNSETSPPFQTTGTCNSLSMLNDSLSVLGDSPPSVKDSPTHFSDCSVVSSDSISHSDSGLESPYSSITYLPSPPSEFLQYTPMFLPTKDTHLTMSSVVSLDATHSLYSTRPNTTSSTKRKRSNSMKSANDLQPQQYPRLKILKPPKDLLTEKQKKSNHIVSEKKRRSNIKAGFDQLTDLVPELSNGVHRSEAEILKICAEYIEELLEQQQDLNLQLASNSIIKMTALKH
ncbi:hypothetical protein HK099_002372 [Clydaea vesicula]|uniref:BHLH domain-containing protein n=1 Tax=Clydaea vesicula TaxID=447962 RepID=A0AAD5TTI8_9FUNG|nr:hypothetical protein HK099_002372 [Clydaea vesicula]